ncbi:DUF6640 family protein [Pseudonocardia broussonetiae]|uniref:DUF4149 domain-containing protein n=1 Tax=Pseudonocardia broussonetiae TaxID=2736640 RepID=A0A6M6JNN0_9PSEU|nr:DUF6640 family protein [Pseudonocardia broussonetiae]QJY48049.1 hypothetical protein HOP40_21460 [Pseudonocardia broussonetiae]
MSAARRASRALVGLIAVGTTVGPLVVDALLPVTARQHLRNPRWPGHAKFHNAQYIVMSAVLGVVGLRLVTTPHGDPDHNLLTATAMLSAPWVGMYGAAAFPGTALVDEEFRDSPANTVLGVEVNILVGSVCLSLLGASLALGRRANRAG